MRYLLAIIAMACFAKFAQAQTDFIVLQSTTSTHNSGLLDAILPEFTQATGIEVRVIAVGTGQAIRNAMNGDGDVLLVHSRDEEEAFVAEGWGVSRANVMFNDFVIVGPVTDPAEIASLGDVTDVLAKIAASRSEFLSRGDDSGTHKKELSLWRDTGIDVQGHNGTWYLESGAGMGATLNIAVQRNSYVLSDRGTWIAFGNKLDHAVLFEGDPDLFNQYGVILISPERNPGVREDKAKQLVDWLLGEAGQAAIAAFRINGQQLFFPNANVR